MPATVSYGEAFAIGTPDAARIATVRWIRLSSVTHSFNQSQRSALAPRDFGVPSREYGNTVMVSDWTL